MAAPTDYYKYITPVKMGRSLPSVSKNPPEVREKRLTQVKLLILNKTKWRCCYCGIDLTLETMTKEHVWPLALGGPKGARNILAACSRCNHKKKNSMSGVDYAYLRGCLDFLGILKELDQKRLHSLNTVV